MRRTFTIAIGVVTLLALSATIVLAQNPHFTGRGPSITPEGNNLRITGRIAGLGSEPLRVHATAPATIDVDCRNPGGNVAPGQRTTTNVAGSTPVVTPDRNGRYDLNMVLTAPTPSAGDVCPNARWSVEITNVSWGPVTISVEQPIGSTPRVIYP